LVRTCLARLQDSRAFGPLVAGAAPARDFYAASRRAFGAGGRAYNWAIRRGYFPDFVPIADFAHVVCYLFAAAHVLAQEPCGRWARYEASLDRTSFGCRRKTASIFRESLAMMAAFSTSKAGV
jgi:hypothetical protein